MSVPVLCPMSPEMAALLRRPGGYAVTGTLRVWLDDANVINVEVAHDCFLLMCRHVRRRRPIGVRP